MVTFRTGRRSHQNTNTNLVLFKFKTWHAFKTQIWTNSKNQNQKSNLVCSQIVWNKCKLKQNSVYFLFSISKFISRLHNETIIVLKLFAQQIRQASDVPPPVHLGEGNNIPPPRSDGPGDASPDGIGWGQSH